LVESKWLFFLKNRFVTSQDKVFVSTSGMIFAWKTVGLILLDYTPQYRKKSWKHYQCRPERWSLVSTVKQLFLNSYLYYNIPKYSYISATRHGWWAVKGCIMYNMVRCCWWSLRNVHHSYIPLVWHPFIYYSVTGDPFILD
jgi:hypothetical protein